MSGILLCPVLPRLGGGTILAGQMSSDELTHWLEASRRGEPGALDHAFAAVYDDLQTLAHAQLRHRRPGDTIGTTVLVHEAYLRLARTGKLAIETRHHFFALAAQAMRRILVDRVRAQLSQKRGGDAKRVELDDVADFLVGDAEQVLAVHEALQRLSALNARLADLVECRFFAGYSEPETAEALGVSERTVHRDWVKARAWLYRYLYPESAV